MQIVILDSPEIYSEYAPYTYIEDMKEFIDKVAQLNKYMELKVEGSEIHLRRPLFDYYRKKPKICAIPIKPLHCKAFRLDGLITPTL